MAHVLKISVFVVALSLFVQLSLSAVVFTGDVAKDFNAVKAPQNETLIQVPNYNSVTCSEYMQRNNLTSGWDIKGISMQYDWTTDTMYIGWDCWVICGDADGDGDPGRSTDQNNLNKTVYQDMPLQAIHEATCQLLWTDPPKNFVPRVNGQATNQSYQSYYPTIVLGDSYAADLSEFGAYSFALFRECDEPNSGKSVGRDTAECQTRIETAVQAPADYFDYLLTDLAQTGSIRDVPAISLFQYPNKTYPDFEFSVGKFSQYGNFSFRPGVDTFTFATSLFFGSAVDSCGEEKHAPFVVKMPCTVRDVCGICGGDNSSCWDCNHVPNGPAKYDACGICGGSNGTCYDCEFTPNGKKRYDACGVCGGNNHTCWDCFQIPNGPGRYDACGVCGGHNETCLDCAYVANGPSRYDACGVCGGHNETCLDCAYVANGPSRYDSCGVCGGHNETCLDCAGVANGPLRYDSCGVCGGHNETCVDCKNVANGPSRYDACGVCGGHNETCLDCAYVANGPSRYDACGVCGGQNETCLDCAHVANGPSRYDACGVCGGHNETCLDCAHVANGPSRYDSCGVCGGHNETCLDCFGRANGNATYDLCGICGGNSTTCVDCTGHLPTGAPKVYDECGVCDGDNSTCWDCAHIPNGPWVYDLCGVCGGHNEDCECFIYNNITLLAQDTYISLEHRNENYDKSQDLVVSSNKERTLLKFDDIRFSILGATEQKPEILSAKLRLYVRGIVKLPHQGFEDSKLVLHNLDHSFCAEKATWECRDYDDTGCCVDWKMLALYPKIKADYAWEETASIDVHNWQQGWVEFDVKDDIENFLATSFMNSKSYLLKKGCEKDYGWIRFWSSSNGHLNAPQLDIQLKSRCGPVKQPAPVDPCDEQEENDGHKRK